RIPDEQRALGDGRTAGMAEAAYRANHRFPFCACQPRGQVGEMRLQGLFEKVACAPGDLRSQSGRYDEREIGREGVWPPSPTLPPRTGGGGRKSQPADDWPARAHLDGIAGARNVAPVRDEGDALQTRQRTQEPQLPRDERMGAVRADDETGAQRDGFAGSLLAHNAEDTA